MDFLDDNEVRDERPERLGYWKACGLEEEGRKYKKEIIELSIKVMETYVSPEGDLSDVFKAVEASSLPERVKLAVMVKVLNSVADFVEKIVRGRYQQ